MTLTQQERAACAIVERLARTVGGNCEVVFLRGAVQVAPLSWSGAVVEATLARALETALTGAQAATEDW